MDFGSIKLIIWDLDDTFWTGTISEGEVLINEANIELIKNTTDIGIVNSICSKNEIETIKQKLLELNIWDYFVFPSVDWSSKGNRIKKLIDSMKLRYVNVLFVDDNIQNLKEAEHFCPGIMTMLPDQLNDLYEFSKKAEKKDLKHKRLADYHLLEKKDVARSSFDNNEEFLYSCNIEVTIERNCLNHLDRIYDLVIRSNQLNYTKIRDTKEDLERLCQNPTIKSGIVSVRDMFGDYGIVGFFAIQENKLLHFVFSCRTLGMQVEQYVYMLLGCPELKVVGEVVSQLRTDYKPEWINQKSIDKQSSISQQSYSGNILIKGPCDMSQMHSFLSSCKKLDAEFSYTNEEGVLTEGHNHTSQFVTALYASNSQKEEILKSVPFLDKNMLETSFTNKKFDYLVFSMLTDGNIGIYKHIKTGYEICLCEKHYDLTAGEYDQKYISGEIFNSGIQFTDEILKQFRQEFVKVENTKFEKTIDNLEKIYKKIDKQTKLILLLGVEQEPPFKATESFQNRHLEHRIQNEAIRLWAKDKVNVTLISYDQYVRNKSDFLDTINHFSKRVYFDLATDLVKIFNSGGILIKRRSKMKLFIESLKGKLRQVKLKLKKL